jgi:hypothetical protein
MSRDSSVDTVTRLRPGQPTHRGSFVGGGRFASVARRPGRLVASAAFCSVDSARHSTEACS